jgi:TnpA family transposase
MNIRDLVDKEIIYCKYLDHKNYNFKLFEINFEKFISFGKQGIITSKYFEQLDDEEFYMYITDYKIFICEQENKELLK